MGHRSSCGERFPLNVCCHHCHNRCLSSRPCPSAERLHCPGTCQPRWPHESKSFCWDPALSCTKADTVAFSCDNLIHRDQSTESQRCVKILYTCCGWVYSVGEVSFFGLGFHFGETAGEQIRNVRDETVLNTSELKTIYCQHLSDVHPGGMRQCVTRKTKDLPFS